MKWYRFLEICSLGNYKKRVTLETNGLFQFKHTSPVRFQDLDAGGHVHHSVALCFFEEAREAYWASVVGSSWNGEAKYVIAELDVKYHQRIFYPMTLVVGVRTSEIGRKHLVMEYEGKAEEGDLLISGNTMLVMFDYKREASIRVPEDVKTSISNWENL